MVFSMMIQKTKNAELENVESNNCIEDFEKNDNNATAIQTNTIQKRDKSFQCQEFGKLLSSKQYLKKTC